MTVGTFTEADWAVLQELRAQVGALRQSATLVQAAGAFSALFAKSFDTLLLARVFAVLPLSALPARERAFADNAVSGEVLGDTTRALCLLGTAGIEPAWNDRLPSQGHLAIPLSSSEAARDAPMIAQLLTDLRVNLGVLDEGRPVTSLELMGGRTKTFFVEDALHTVDSEGRLVIPAQDFVRNYAIRSVFGMGGSYLDGTLIVSILFTSELLTRSVADRYASAITAFKVATSDLVRDGRIF